MKIGSCFKCGSLDHTTKRCTESVNDKSSGTENYDTFLLGQSVFN